MAVLNHNHVNYQARLEWIRKLLVVRLGLSGEDIRQTKIIPIQYEQDCPFKYNNFVYRVTLPTSTSRGGHQVEQNKAKQPGCVPIPAGTKEFIMRLSNPEAEGMHQEMRVQNEVAIITLASDALRHITPAIVPRIFGWGGTSQEQIGWILQELMPGVPLSPAFSETMSLDQKREILAQIGGILKSLQDYPLPESIKGWGGVAFDDSGAIISAPMTIVGAGPWSSLEDSYRGRLKVALAQADENPDIQGWRINGVRERIDAFIKDGLSTQLSHLTSRQDKAIIHADFTPDNLLYDPTTGRITAFLDYDFASILHPACEFFCSFYSSGGQFSGWSDAATPQAQDASALRNAKLTGQFPSDNHLGMEWELAQAWEEELKKLDVRRPSTIQGIDRLSDVDKFLSSLLPWRLTNGDFLRMNTDEEKREVQRSMSERQLVSLLHHMGF